MDSRGKQDSMSDMALVTTKAGTAGVMNLQHRPSNSSTISMTPSSGTISK